MKATYSCVLALGLLVAGCSEKSDKPAAGSTNTSSSSVVTAPVDYLRSVGDAQKSAVKTVDTTSLDKAISLFNIDQGRNPKDLNELVEKKYIPEVPKAPYGSKLVYDSAAGTVKVVTE